MARVDEKEGIDYYSLEYCAINPFTMIVIPAPIFIGINSSRNPEKQSLDAASSAA